MKTVIPTFKRWLKNESSNLDYVMKHIDEDIPKSVVKRAYELFKLMGIADDDFGLQTSDFDSAVFGGTNRLIANLDYDDNKWKFDIDRELTNFNRVERWDKIPKEYKTISNNLESKRWLKESFGGDKFTVKDVDDEQDWEEADIAHIIFSNNNINYGRDKEITMILLDDDNNVVGGLASNWSVDRDFDAVMFSMDIAVDKGTAGGGMKLVKAGIDEYESQREELKEAYGVKNAGIRSWVVNPRLYQILISRYGFEEEGDGEHVYKY